MELQRAEASARIAMLSREVADIVESASSTTGDDEHDPEGSTVGFERAQALALLDQARADLDALTAALARIDNGSYGICRTCGAPIGEERLAARPAAVECIRCASSRR